MSEDFNSGAASLIEDYRKDMSMASNPSDSLGRAPSSLGSHKQKAMNNLQKVISSKFRNNVTPLEKMKKAQFLNLKTSISVASNPSSLNVNPEENKGGEIKKVKTEPSDLLNKFIHRTEKNGNSGKNRKNN